VHSKRCSTCSNENALPAKDQSNHHTSTEQLLAFDDGTLGLTLDRVTHYITAQVITRIENAYPQAHSPIGAAEAAVSEAQKSHPNPRMDAATAGALLEIPRARLRPVGNEMCKLCECCELWVRWRVLFWNVKA
jgi:hypothetical protein